MTPTPETPVLRRRLSRVIAAAVAGVQGAGHKSRERLYLFDTTLRDGAQTNGVDFTLHDKLAIAALLDDLGIDYIEGGYPGANPVDYRTVSRVRAISRSTFTAFGMTRRPGRSAANDPGLAALLDAQRRRHLLCGKVLGFPCARRAHDDARRQSRFNPRQRARRHREGPRSASRLRAFFDGYKANPDYALACARTAYEAGARWVVLCDTNGGTLPHEIEAIVGAATAVVPGDHLGIHAHNDTEQAVANSLAAVRAGRGRFRARSMAWASAAATPTSFR